MDCACGGQQWQRQQSHGDGAFDLDAWPELWTDRDGECLWSSVHLMHSSSSFASPFGVGAAFQTSQRP